MARHPPFSTAVFDFIIALKLSLCKARLSSAHDAQNADNARKNTAFPPVCKKCAKVCRAPEKGKSHEESYDSSWDFGALEGTRIPGPLIKSQMLYRLSYERIFLRQNNTAE